MRNAKFSGIVFLSKYFVTAMHPTLVCVGYYNKIPGWV